MQTKKISDVMTRNVITLPLNATLLDAMKIMSKKRIGSIVITKNKIPTGIITERDVVRLFSKNKQIFETKLVKVMSSPLKSIESNQPVSKADEMLLKHRIRRLIVKDKNKFVGIVTETDLLRGTLSEDRALYEEEKKTVKELKKSQKKLTKAYEDLKKADELKSTILRDVAHELLTPISVVIMVSNLLKKDIAENRIDKKKALHHLDLLSENSERFKEQIFSVLDLSRLETTTHIDVEKINLGALLREVVKTEKPKIKNKKIKIKLIAKRNINFVGNEALLRRLMRNLINNSIKYTKKGLITVTCIKKKNSLVYSVKDTGIGISKKNIKKLFEPFSQVDPSKEGIGVGLAICKKIVNLHEGKIKINSKLGKGTIFIVELPLKVLK